MKKLLCLLALGVILSSGLVWADPPLTVSNPEQYSRDYGVSWGHAHAVPTSSGVAGFVATGTSAASAVTNMRLFKWGTPVTISCPAAATFCWTMASDATMTVTGWLTTPSGNTGVGQCWRIPIEHPITKVPRLQPFRVSTAVGRRTGICTGNTYTTRYPCRVDADCGPGGTCNTTCSSSICSNRSQAPMDFTAGAFLTSLASSGTTCVVEEGN
jgi:hypothetical protein